MKSNNFFKKFGAQGYYIALILCACAIGISGYLYYRNATQNDPALQDPTTDVGLQDPTVDNLPVGGTQPGDDQLQGTEPTVPNEKPEQMPLKTQTPLAGNIISSHAVDCLAYNETTRDWRTHNGIDIAAEAGTEVRAAANGTVYTVFSDDAYGTTVVVRHTDGYVTVYSSLDKDVAVTVGDTVTMGQTIGKVGNTALLETAIGDHLHFSVSRNDQPVDPMDFLNLN